MRKRLSDLRGKLREPALNDFFHENIRKKTGDSRPQPGIEIPGGVEEKTGSASVPAFRPEPAIAGLVIFKAVLQ